ncbi:MAG TPA: hypothetical protein VKV25_00890, partial [Acidimicrobiales bacterium]|nr:hypothetical protein [Acidimicrobiales bacterium]
MATSTETLKDELIGRVAARAAGEPVQAAFVRCYFADVPVDDLTGRDEDELYEAAASNWRMARRRRRGETLVAVTNPPPAGEGAPPPDTVVQIVTDDMPFLVDSVVMELSRHQLGINLVIHPVVAVTRDAGGHLVDAGDGAAAGALAAGPETPDGTMGFALEAFLRLEVTRQADDALAPLEQDLRRVLGDVRLAVEDWGPMRRQVEDAVAEAEGSALPIAPEEVAEGIALLRWLVDDHFVFLGYRQYRLGDDGDGPLLHPVPETGLGILRPRPDHPPGPVHLSRRAAALARDLELLVLTKANSRSTVHRPSRLDYIGVRQFGPDGKVIGEHRFLGLFRVSAYASLASEIPVVRRKVADVIERSGFLPGSYSAKLLKDVLETYPRDELIQATAEELFATAVAVAGIQERQQVRLFCRTDLFGRFVSCLVYLPRDRFNRVTRNRVGELLRSVLGGTGVDVTAYLSESVLVRLHYVVQVDPDRPVDIDVPELQDQVAAATRSWDDELRAALIARHGEQEGDRRHRRWGPTLPAAYREDFAAADGVADIDRIESLGDDVTLAMTLYQPPGGPESLLRLKLVGSGPPVSLSDIVPVLEHMGARVADERPYTLRGNGDRAWVYDFGLIVEEADRLASEKVGAAFQDAVAQVLRGRMESDGFNRLVLAAGLEWREVVVLRATCKYLRQTQTTFSQAYMEDTLTRHPQIARQLVELFVARFAPGGGGTGAGAG